MNEPSTLGAWQAPAKRTRPQWHNGRPLPNEPVPNGRRRALCYPVLLYVCIFLRSQLVGPMNTILLVAWAISAVALIVLVLMHSGKGTGVSDMIASSMYNANAGSGVWEKNLDRLTVIAAVVFMATIVIFMLTYPLGTVASLG